MLLVPILIVIVSSVFAFDLKTCRALLDGLQKSRVLPLRDPRNGFTLFSLNSTVLLPAHKFSPAQSLAAQVARLSLLELNNESNDAYSFDLVLSSSSENAFSKPNSKTLPMCTQFKPPRELLRLYDLLGDEETKMTLESLISGTIVEMPLRMPAYVQRHRGPWLKYCAKAAFFSWILAQQHLSQIRNGTDLWLSLQKVLDSHDEVSRMFSLIQAMHHAQRRVDYVDGFSAHMVLFYVFSYFRYHLALRADFLHDVAESWKNTCELFHTFMEDGLKLAEHSLKNRKLLVMMDVDAFLTENDYVVPRRSYTYKFNNFQPTFIKSIFVYNIPIQSESVISKTYTQCAMEDGSASILVYTNHVPKDANAFMRQVRKLFQKPISFANLREYFITYCQGLSSHSIS